MKRVLDGARARVEIRITGASPQELINRMARANIPFWDLRRQDELCWYITMYAADYKRLRPMIKRSMCRTHVMGRRGFPFFARRMKKRRVLLAGLALCVATAMLLPMFVWSYQVEGNETVPTQAILRALDEIGVGVGTFGPSIHPSVVKNKMLLKLPQLAWLTVNVSGGIATVVVREETPKPDILDENMVTDLVASATGIVTSMEILRGREQVRVGQTVLEGEKLVSGVIEHRSYDTLLAVQQVRSMGEVYATTWRKLTARMPLEYRQKSYTGEKKTKYALLIGKKRLNLCLDSGNSYEEYDKITHRDLLTLPGGLTFPIGIEKTVIRAYESAPVMMPVEQAQATLEKYLLEAVKAQMTGGEILDSSFSADLCDGLLEVSVVCRCREQIAREVPAEISGLENDNLNERAP